MELKIMDIEIFLFFANIVMLFVSNRTFDFLYQDDLDLAKPRIKMSLYLAGTLFILQVIHILIVIELVNKDYVEIITKLSYSIGTIYFMLFAQSIVHYFIKKKLGDIDNVDNRDIASDTPASRMWSLLTLIIIIFSTIYANIQIWSAASLMETTGIVGLTLGAMALTNSVWFPDIYSGILILKNKSFSVGDVVSFNNEDEPYIVHKTSFSNLSLLSVTDNNRTTLRNNLLTGYVTHNLSKVASQKGLRRTIPYKLGYPSNFTIEESKTRIIEMKKEKKYENIDLTIEDVREKVITDYIEKIRKIARESYEELIKRDSKTNYLAEHEFQIAVGSTADHAIEFILSFYIKPLPKSFVVEKIRDHLIKVPYAVNEMMLKKAYRYNEDLSTPITIKEIENT